ncbi:CLUMA_CG021366, isoform A [Clunio marinus]|uniref:CLUMA_CG021366, isoform A n=1 Tax=Clunio marinus TaxID=568069 RepID=A0A1J1J828_9DIPT|nr:CLUMA_CG021366, isoform A [Clunio marinus]
MVDVCCLRMSARCSRPIRSTMKDITKLSNAGSNHDCGSLSRVVMVRKTDQRVINHKNQKDPQTEVITMETISTYRGHRPDRTVVIKKRDLSANAVLSTSMSERDHGYSSLTPSRTIKSEISKDFSSLSLLTPDDANTLNNSLNNSPNSNPRKTILNGNGVRDSNNNPYGTPTMYAKHNRNSLNTRIQQEDRSFSKSSTSLRSSPALRNSPGLRHSTPSPCNRRSIFSDFELDCLKAHNEYRARHGVAALKLNKKLCKHAEEWARILANRGILLHRNNSIYGENIFCSWSSNIHNNHVSGREPVDNWYAEISHHVFHKEPTTLKSGHFTQVVWKESRELGVGMAKNRSGEVFVVANYDPPGNFIGSFEKNVLPILGEDDKMRASMEKSDEEIDEVEYSEEEYEAFAQKILKHHNEYRKKHYAHELRLTKELMNDAQQWAEKLAAEDKFTYRQNSQYGENLYCLWSSDRDAWPNAKDVCKSWYEEVKQYIWNVEPKTSFKAGQFSQLVWKSSRELGVGVGRTKSGKVIVVASYWPRGNIIGQFLQNVKKGN